MLGQTVSHYKIKEKLGGGGMGVVYLAQDTRLERSVAIKFLPPAYFEDDQAVKRFQREAKAAASLNHPHICTVHDIGETDGQPYLVMEHLEGETLKHKLAKAPLPIGESLKLAVQIADALQTAHQKGIIHRDIKPANIFVTERGDAKVLDFGLAKQLGKQTEGEEDLSTALTRAGSTLGTLNYMSPEQVKGEVLDPRTDIFSLGVVLYEMLTGLNPFRRNTSGESISSILNEDPQPLSRYADDAPEALQHTLRKMLAKNPERRAQTMRGVQNDLEQLVEDSGRQPMAETQRSRRWHWLVAIPALLLVVVLGIYWIDLSQPGEISDSALTQAIEEQKSIAVLPFENLSPNPDDEYFSNGITEDITTALTKIGDLRVVGRASSFLSEDSPRSVRELAREFGIGTILEGSVRRTGGQVRIVAQLISAETNENLWAETYTRNLDDIFAIQSDVAEQIASALRLELSPDEVQQIEKPPTSNLEAYNLSLQGRYLRFQETPEGLRRSLEAFERAVELDPHYALAHAGLAEAAIALGWYAPGERPELMEKAEAAVQRALELDETVAEAHVSLFLLNDNRGEPEAAMGNLRRANHLNPNLPNAHREMGLMLWRHQGALQKALDEIREAHRLDPLSGIIVGNLGAALVTNGLIEEAMRLARQRQLLYPGRVGWVSANTHFVLSNWPRAETLFREYYADNPSWGNILVRSYLRQLYWLEGRTDDARREAEWWLKAPTYPGFPSHLAVLYAGLVEEMDGNHRKALESFERAYQLSSTPVQWSQLVSFQPYEYSSWLGHAFLREGRLEDAQEKLDETVEYYQKMIAVGDEHPKVNIGLAGVYAIRGEKQEAYRWLERAIEGGFLEYRYLERHPFFANLHGDPRFQQMMAGVKQEADGILGRVREMEKEWGWE